MKRAFLILPAAMIAAGCASDGSDETSAVAAAQTPPTLPQLVTADQPPAAPPPPPKRERGPGGRLSIAEQRDAATVYWYEDDRVFPVTVSPKRGTVVQLGNNERLSRVPVIGDTLSTDWFVESTRGKRDFVVIQCARVSARTSLFITTTINDYQLDLACTGQGMDRVRWEYDEPAIDPAPVRTAFEPNAQATALHMTVEDGDKPEWMPSGSWYANGRTFVEFPAIPTTLPGVFTADGAPIAFRINGKTMEIDRPLSDALLRLGETSVRIRRTG